MGIILWVIFGALAGWIASMIMGNKDGLLIHIVIGIVGAILGGWIMTLFGKGGVNGFNLYSFLVAIIGAIVLIWIVGVVRGARI